MIPRVFHFVFGLREEPEPFHLAFYLCLESCRQVNEPDEIYFHCHHEPYGRYWELVRDELTLVPVEPDPFVADFGYPDRGLDRYRYAHHADVVRLDALIEHGGIYADIDTIFVDEIPDHLFEEPFVLGREDDVTCQRTGTVKPSLCNALIMSEPGAVFARTWRRRIYEAFDGSWSNHSGFLSHELSRELPDQIHVEPSRTFYKHMFTRDGIRMLLEELDPDLEGVVSMHLWSHLWWDEGRRDFSRFHADLLTEDYVRDVDTTYSLVARQFLPEPVRGRRPTGPSAMVGSGASRTGPAREGPAVSVIIPTYNRSGLLAKAVESVLAQTHPIDEIVIVDDGSDGRHRDAVAELASTRSAVRVHELPCNRGASHARNRGLARATGDYVLFLDDDDLIDRRMVETALSRFQAAGDADVVVCRGRFFYPDGRTESYSGFHPFFTPGPLELKRGWVRDWLDTSTAHYADLERRPLRALLAAPPPIHACLVDREAVGRVRFPEEIDFGEDWIFWLELALKRCRFRFNPRGRVYIRRHPQNGSSRARSAARIACREHVMDRVTGAGREEEFLAAAELLRTYLRHGRGGWHPLLGHLVGRPDLLWKHGHRFAARRIYRAWRALLARRRS